MNPYDYKLMECLDKGIKDVIWIDYDEELVKILSNKGYYKKKSNDTFGGLTYFFFRHKHDKEYFMNNCLKHIKNRDIQSVDEEMGKLLGFPPRASELFRDRVRNKERNIFINFCGMYFASYPDSIKEDVEWLIENKPLIDGEVFEIADSKFIIGEDNWLNCVYKLINELNESQ